MPCSNELCCRWIWSPLSLSCIYPLVLEKGNKTGFISLLIKHNEVRGPRLIAMAFKNTKTLEQVFGIYIFFNLLSNPDNYTTDITTVRVLWRRKCCVRDASDQCIIFSGIIYKHLSRSCTTCGLAPPSSPLSISRIFPLVGPSSIKNPVSLDQSEGLTWAWGVNWSIYTLKFLPWLVPRSSPCRLSGWGSLDATGRSSQLKRRARTPRAGAVTSLLSTLLSVS